MSRNSIIEKREVRGHHWKNCCIKIFEIGRSGQRYDREHVISALIVETSGQEIHSSDFALSVLDDTCVLLTYRSYTIDQQGGIGRQTLRTSLWVKSTNEPTDWQMRFHQGTPQMPDTQAASDRL
jgi:hypothetical protein